MGRARRKSFESSAVGGAILKLKEGIQYSRVADDSPPVIRTSCDRNKLNLVIEWSRLAPQLTPYALKVRRW